MPDCSVSDCSRPARRGREMCHLHAQRKVRGTPLEAPPQERLSPFARFVEACIALADAPSESESAFDLAIDQARKAACTWMRSMGWAPTATEALAESVCEVIHAGGDASGQCANKRLQAGQVREPGRDACVGEGNPRARRQSLGSGAHDARGTDREGSATAGSVQGRGGDPRPSGPEADRNRRVRRGSAE